MKKFIKSLGNLHEGEDNKETTLENVKKNISFRGANLWILACAIVIASIGLNINSTAVIIGAMLISPLMGPIIAIGFALGTHDISLLKRSLRNLAIATVTSILVSALYFFLSPFKEVQSELLARTSPNIYDILIAFFGGIVGVIAITRVEKGNPIPGVAIATALMPPLCTAGYGLATGNMIFFFGALYLYSMNCVFICLATLLMVKFLRYPRKAQLDEAYRKRIKYFVYSAIVLMILPGIYFAYTLHQKQQFYAKTDVFITQEFLNKNDTILFEKINYNPRGNTIELAFLERQFGEEEIGKLNEKLPKYGLKNATLTIRQNNNLNTLKAELLSEIKKSENTVLEKNKLISELENKITTNTIDEEAIFAEIQILFPDITDFSLAKHTILSQENKTKETVVLTYASNQNLSVEEEEKMKQYIRQRLQIEDIDIYTR